MNLAAMYDSWSMAPGPLRALDAMAASVERLTLAGLSPADKPKVAYNGGNPLAPEIVGDTATLEVIGGIVARAPWYLKAFAGVLDPYDLADAVDALAVNPAIKRLVLEVDSGGGTTNGTGEAAAALARFQAAGKTVEARIYGTCASAAYWLVCGADRITASATSQVGYLGTIITLHDETQALAASGVRVEVIASPNDKAACMDPAITAPARADAKRRVEAITAVFRDAVSAGRGMDVAALDAVFTGGGWIAAEAVTLGLIDAVASPADEIDAATGSDTPPAQVLPEVGDDAGPESHHQVAAATNEQEFRMEPKLLAALAALSATHPTHAEALALEAGKPGSTADALHAFAAPIAAKALADANAAELANLREQAKAATVRAEAAEAAQAKAVAALAAVKAHVPGHEDPGTGTDKTAAQKSRSAMTGDEQGAFILKHGQAAYLALPA